MTAFDAKTLPASKRLTRTVGIGSLAALLTGAVVVHSA
jgi:hypothetical protein